MNAAGEEWADTYLGLRSMVRAFEDSSLLLAAAELDLFPHVIESPKTAAEIATALGVPVLASTLFLNALTSLDVLEKRDDRYRVQDRYRSLLSDGPHTMLRVIATSRKSAADVFARLPEIMTGRASVPSEYGKYVFTPSSGDPSILTFNLGAAAAVVNELIRSIEPARRVLDVGGGDGSFAANVLARCPGVEYTILDLPGEHAASRHLGRELALGALRIEDGDARTFAMQSRYDLVVLNELMELFTREEKEVVVRNAMRALVPGGRLIATKFRLGDDGTEPVGIAFLSLMLSLMKKGVYLESDKELVEIVEQAGFVGVERRRIGIKCAVVGDRSR